MYESGFGRLIGVLISPRKTFEAIAARPTWVAALLALLVVMAVVGYVSGGRTDWDDVMRGQFAQSEQEVPPEMVEQQIAFMEKSGRLLSMFGGLGVAVFALVAAALCLLAFRLLGSELDFVSSLAVTFYSLMPMIVAALLSLPVILSKPSLGFEDVRSGSFLASNLGVLAGEDTAPALRALLASVDFFSLWNLALLIIGYRVVARVSGKTAGAVVIGLWLLTVAIRVGWTAAFT
jgi:hypothetical protein